MALQSESPHLPSPSAHRGTRVRGLSNPESRELRRKKSPALIAACLSLWAVAIVLGGRELLRYECRPGDVAAGRSEWPAGSSLRPPTDRPVLLMFMHPHCPCSRASLNNLDRLMTHASDRVRVEILFVEPMDTKPGWARGALWDRATELRGVQVRVDRGGKEAKRFAATVSGQVVVYDEHGRLAFRGGLTPARGHEGDNRGMDLLIARFLGTDRSEYASTPVFGCPLLDDQEDTAVPGEGGAEGIQWR